MGQITKSLAIASLFPKSMESFEALEKTLRYIKGRGFSMVEFYTPPGHDREAAKLLKETGFASVLIAVYALKGAGFSLCAPEEAERLKAVEVLKACLDRGAVMGCRRVLINSGFLPKDKGLVDAACESYIRSIREAYAYIVSKGYTLDIVLEPGDSCVQSFQLLGPTDRVVKTTERIRSGNPGYGLTMDVAHLREEGEDIPGSLIKTLPHCSHIHLCNCVMDDPKHPFYGDKHVDFDYPGASFGYADFERMYGEIRCLYKGRDFIITLESLCRAEDNERWFDEMAGNCSWL